MAAASAERPLPRVFHCHRPFGNEIRIGQRILAVTSHRICKRPALAIERPAARSAEGTS
nr:hypothetical protein [Agrobacterium tumefaciens]